MKFLEVDQVVPPVLSQMRKVDEGQNIRDKEYVFKPRSGDASNVCQ